MAEEVPTGDGNANGNVEEEMDEVEKEMIQGRSGGVKGIIFPPPDIRAVVDKTAQWCVSLTGRRIGQVLGTSVLDAVDPLISQCFCCCCIVFHVVPWEAAHSTNHCPEPSPPTKTTQGGAQREELRAAHPELG